MQTKGNTVLITGGATGIGLSLAERFIQAGNEVIVCGRREEMLDKAKAELPALHTRRCDLSKADERRRLHDWAVSEFERLNVLVNNAGIQRMLDFRADPAALFDGEDEIEINFKAVAHLCAHFIPDLMAREQAAIVNVSSGLAFVPLAVAPIYCATKAALHSFCLSLRHQLEDTPVKVFELIPPMVDTDLDKGARDEREQEERGIQPGEVAAAALEAMAADELEIAVGRAAGLRAAAASGKADQVFQNMNRW